MRRMRLLALALFVVGCGGGTDDDPASLDRSSCVPDESAPVPAGRCSTTSCGQWVKVDIPGATCSDGSQYKIFVNLSQTSNDLEVMFEPGGACWDYPSCSGAGGIRGAANPHGIPDDHMDNYQYLNLLRRTDDNPAKDWNLVFLPYCTGDIHTGNRVATYTNPAGGDPLVFRHVGHDNVMKSIAWLAKTFTKVPRLLVTGCSAGGAGSTQNYYFVREGLPGAQCGYLLNDSGPAFHSDGPSAQLHATVREAWNVDPILDGLEGKLPVAVADLKRDFGLINLALADKYPHDRMTLALYRMDLDYSLYSYQRFFPGSSEADIHGMWEKDIEELTKSFDTRANLAYYVANFRHDNCSHCITIPPIGHDISTILQKPWLGSEIEQDGIDMKQFTADLLDADKPLESYVEDAFPQETFTAEESAQCLEGGG
jgi:pectinacetylesterase